MFENCNSIDSLEAEETISPNVKLKINAQIKDVQIGIEKGGTTHL